MMSDTAIYTAFAGLVSAFAASAGLPCSYPGTNFTPPDTGSWLELQWFPNETQNYGLSDDGPSLMRGFAQLSACYRPGAGIVIGTTLTDQIIAAFGKGTTFAGMRVYRKPWTGSIIQDSERVMHPVTIYWRGFDQ